MLARLLSNENMLHIISYSMTNEPMVNDHMPLSNVSQGNSWAFFGQDYQFLILLFFIYQLKTKKCVFTNVPFIAKKTGVF